MKAYGSNMCECCSRNPDIKRTTRRANRTRARREGKREATPDGIGPHLWWRGCSVREEP